MTSEKDPLSNEWVLHYDATQGSKQKNATQWENHIKVVASTKTVQDFWGIFNNIKTPSALEVSANYHFFKKGIKPAWEDIKNADGGIWKLTLDRNEAKEFDHMYEESLMALVGEQFEHGESISGMVASVRKKEFRLVLWIQNCDKDICMSIGKFWRDILGLPEFNKLEFSKHDNRSVMYTV